jgi:hypothetical protein
MHRVNKGQRVSAKSTTKARQSRDTLGVGYQITGLAFHQISNPSPERDSFSFFFAGLKYLARKDVMGSGEALIRCVFLLNHHFPISPFNHLAACRPPLPYLAITRHRDRLVSSPSPSHSSLLPLRSHSRAFRLTSEIFTVRRRA